MMQRKDSVNITSSRHCSSQEHAAGAPELAAARENAKRVLRESGLPHMLQEINTTDLKRRGWFEEYDTVLLLKWGTGYTRRHLWIEVVGDTIRFKLAPHRLCDQLAPVCDGEYHTFTSSMWRDPDLLRAELYRYFRKPVAESSDD